MPLRDAELAPLNVSIYQDGERQWPSGGQDFSTRPPSASSVSVIRAPSTPPRSPIQRVYFRSAVASSDHQPRMTVRAPIDRVT